MARAARRGDDEPISVDELLRETGAKPRPRTKTWDETLTLRREPVEPLDPDQHRERLERQAAEAAYQQQRAGSLFRRLAVTVAAAIVLGGLVLVVLTSGNRPLGQGTLQVVPPLQPATSSPAASTKPVPQPPAAPVPATMSATESTSATATTRPGAKPPAAPPPASRAACVVRYTVQDQWDTGFGAAVTITNTGSAPISPWSLSWTYTAGQRLTQGWDGNYSQSGSRVTVSAASWNETIAPGGSVSTGFNGAHNGSNPAPGGFTLNGGSCATG